MKKIFCFVASVMMLVSCNLQNNNRQGLPNPAYYSDWDRAIRIDVDMQNMYKFIFCSITRNIK